MLNAQKWDCIFLREAISNSCDWLFLNYPFFQNGDGFINRQELGYVMDNLGLQMDKDEIEVVFEKIDFIISFDFQIEGDRLKYR